MREAEGQPEKENFATKALKDHKASRESAVSSCSRVRQNAVFTGSQAAAKPEKPFRAKDAKAAKPGSATGPSGQAPAHVGNDPEST